MSADKTLQPVILYNGEGTELAPTLATTSQVPRVAATVSLASANLERKGWIIHNDSPARLYVKLGSGASSTDYSVKMHPRATYELPFPTYLGEITGVWASAGAGFAAITEMT
jgi:hypothetical protein